MTQPHDPDRIKPMGKLKDRYEERVLPVVIDKLCGNKAGLPHRSETVAGTHGVVLEIGFGSGHNLALYPSAVEMLYVVEPSARAIELARERIAQAPFPVEVVGLNGESIPLGDDSVDCVVSTFSLCTIPDVAAALREVHRVLKPHGTLHVLEHGLADESNVQRWQHRLNPTQRRFCGGCNLIRHVPSMLTTAGFRLDEVHRWYEKGPKALSAFTRATASPIPHA